MPKTGHLNHLASLLIRATVCAVVALLCLLFASGQAQAAQIPVSSACSLVNAIASANTDSSVAGCVAGSGADTILLNDSLVSFSTPDNNYLGDNNALPAITSTITISSNLGSAPAPTLRREQIGCSAQALNDAFRFFVVDSPGDLTLKRIAMQNGCAVNGGAIYNHSGKVTLLQSELISNTALGSGGALFALTPDSVVTITNSFVHGNLAGLDGGGLFFAQGSVAGSALYANRAQGDGGAILAYQEVQKSLSANRIFENVSGGEGSALYLRSASLQMDNNLIYSNVTTATKPADIALGIFITPSTLSGYHNTMVAGTQPATAIVAGVDVPGDRVFVTDTIFSNYTVGLSARLTATIVADGVLWDNTATPTETLSGGAVSVAHAYFGSAAYVDPSTNDYHLTVNSPAINRGVSNSPAFDYEGTPRPTGLASDLGADEFVPDAAITISKTVGLDGSTCASSHQITVTSNSTVFYCFTLTNSGNVTLTQHTLNDGLLGVVNATLTYTLAPGASLQITHSLISALGPVTITQSVTNTVAVTSTDESAPVPDETVQSIGQFGLTAADSDSAVVIAQEPTDLPVDEQPRNKRLYLPSALQGDVSR